tara:strand:- start:1533 stop:1964 length:432 start_codon:yes stop_codon:yes gene_type:complete
MSAIFDIDTLSKALENEENEELLNLDNSKIKCIKNDILQKLGLPTSKLKAYHKTLKKYRYIDELPGIRYGAYIRWISLRDPANIKLTNGGIICDIKVEDCIHIVCKNNMNRFFEIKMGECLIFQKLSEQEQILLSAMDYLHEK